MSFSGSQFLLIGWQEGRESLVIAAGLDVSHGVTLSGFADFLGLELKHNRGLDVFSSLTETLSLWSTDPRLYS